MRDVEKKTPRSRARAQIRWSPDRPRKWSALPYLGLACLLLSLVPAPAHAGTSDADRTLTQVRSHALSAVRRHGELVIDGHIGEGAWSQAPAGTQFWQRNPNEGAPPELATEFRVLYDDRAVYVAVRAFDSNPDEIRGLLTRRDEESPSDWIWVGFDSYFDKRTAFAFGINPAGVKRDRLLFDDTNFDDNWNAVWEGAAAVDELGWTAEFRIPLGQLRFSGAPEQTWGLQVARLVGRTHEETYWAPWPREATRQVGLFGELDGIRDVRPGLRLELLPYALVGADVQPTDTTDSSAALYNVGLDAKYGVTPNLTLDVSVNPDFGQVEADPSQVNLTAQETFFPEQRPFFLEGRDIFRYSLGQGDGDGAVETLFYSRRIGARPHDSPSGALLFDAPDATTIWGAAKLSGKTAGGWSVGALSALTAEESARADTGMGIITETIEPLTHYGVLRLKKDFDRGNTSIGFLLSGVERALDGTGLAPLLHRSAYTSGLEYTQLFAGGRYYLEAKLFGSTVGGSAEAIDLTQRASQRYFQRPDADYLDYDPTRTHLEGFGAQYLFAANWGKHWRGAAGGDTRSPGFEANDLGFQRRADLALQWLWAQYRDETPGRYLRSYSLGVNGWEVINYRPAHLDAGGNVNANLVFPNYYSVQAGVNLEFSALAPGALRGGPELRDDFSWNAWLGAISDNRKKLSGSVSGNVWQQPASDSYSYSLSAAANVQAASNLRVSLGTFYEVAQNHSQYVTDATDPNGALHYLLAHIAQDTVGITLRADYTVTPTLSLQVYAQPFVAAGAYTRYKDVDAPMAARYADRFHVYGAGEISETAGVLTVDRDQDGVPDFSFERPDFSFRELRSNVVVRWEYLPGSTLFLVWSHGRESSVSDGAFRLGHDLTELGKASGEHVFLAKLNYWFGT